MVDVPFPERFEEVGTPAEIPGLRLPAAPNRALGMSHRPLKTGLRFSRKARGPSFPSSDINTGMP